MTTLVVAPLRTDLSQTISVQENKIINLAGIRPYLYLHNSPTGTVDLNIKYSATTIATKTFDLAQVKTDLGTADDYMRVWYRVQFDDVVNLNEGQYDIELSSNTYSFSSSSYVAWVQEHEYLTNTLGYTPAGDQENPFSLQLWEYRSH